MFDCISRNNSSKCSDYNKCKILFGSFMSGSEPNYNDKARIGWTIQLISTKDPVNQERKNRYLKGLKKQLVSREQEPNDGVLYTKFQA